ncbi:MAG: hypothetical protein K0R33_2704 [Mycobacterium sp.]|nr:hypothetical protein [Mycobacterium sp.]
MNEAASAAAVPAAAAACQRVHAEMIPRSLRSSPPVPTICQVSIAALTGNSQMAAVSAPTVYAVVAAAPVSWLYTAASAWNADG